MDFHTDAYTLGSEAALELFFKEAANFTQMLKAVRPRVSSLKTPLSPHTIPQGAFGADPSTVAAIRKARPTVPAPSPTVGRVTTGSIKTAWLDLAATGALGAMKAHRSKAHPNEEVEGALRGAGGYYMGAVAGGVLGAAAGALIGGGIGKLTGAKPFHLASMGRQGPPLPGGVFPGLVAGGLGGMGYGGYKGYKGMTSKYDE